MAELINFLLESTLWLGIFFLVYQVFLRRINWPLFNRFFLLSGLLVSVILPLLHLDIWFHQPQPFIIYLGETVERISISAIPATPMSQKSSGGFLPWPLLIYLFVSILLLGHLVLSLFQIYFYKKNPHRLPDNLLAFSHFNFIYMHPKLQEKEHADLILIHEKAHANQWHSMDILLIQLIRIGCWANPLLWIYQKCLRETHEYLADKNVLEKYPERALAYQQQILNLQFGIIQPALVNNFNNLPYKKRIAMIKKKQITRRGKKTLALSMFLFAFTLFACKEVIDTFETDLVYQVDELDQLKLSSNPRSFYENIQRSLKYPAEARMNEVSGTYYISFSVTREGQVINVEVNKHGTLSKTLSEIVVVGYGKMKNVPKLGLNEMETDLPPTLPAEKQDKANAEHALEQSLIETFQSLSPLNPGTKDGKPVKIRLEIPITFKLG